MLCVVAFSRSVSTSCSVCPQGCDIGIDLDPGARKVYRRSCQTNQQLKASSSFIRVASTKSLVDDEFTVTVVDEHNYNNLTSGVAYHYFKDLSSGPFNDESVEATCFSSSGTHMFAEGTVLYIIIRCTNEFFDCSLSIGIEHECMSGCGAAYCGSHGTCTSGGCVCDVGYTGNTCETVLDRCGNNTSCGSQGICKDEECFCRPGYSGDRCQTLDSCHNISCGPHGVCTTGVCVCDLGYSGDRCQTFDICHNVSCGSHGTCDNGQCLCSPGYSGTRCQTFDPCLNISCGSNGTCSNGICVCDPGYSGDLCHIRSCLNASCSPHGICINGTCNCNDSCHQHFNSLNFNTITIACSISVAAVLSIIIIAFIRYKRYQHQQLELDEEGPVSTDMASKTVSMVSNDAYYESVDSVVASSTAKTSPDYTQTYSEILQVVINDAYSS